MINNKRFKLLFIFNFDNKNFFFKNKIIKDSYSFEFIKFIGLLYNKLSWIKSRVLYYINNWVYTTNHRRIAVNYFWFVILSGIIGMVLATVIRLELAYPGVGIFAGDSLQYLSMVTAHGVIMVFFMIMPLLFGAFGNFLLPTQLGVHDVAFPRLNSAAFWFLPAGLIMLGQLVCIDRRYQRMNCFNIREVQSLLKRKFFNDLINSHDYHELLNNTMIGLKYKTNDIGYVDSNTKLFYNFGLEINNKHRQSYYNTKTISYSNLEYIKPDSYLFYLINKNKLGNFKFFSLLNKIYFKISNFNISNTVFIKNNLNSLKSFSFINSFNTLVIFFFDKVNNLTNHCNNIMEQIRLTASIEYLAWLNYRVSILENFKGYNSLNPLSDVTYVYSWISFWINNESIWIKFFIINISNFFNIIVNTTIDKFTHVCAFLFINILNYDSFYFFNQISFFFNQILEKNKTSLDFSTRSVLNTYSFSTEYFNYQNEISKTYKFGQENLSTFRYQQFSNPVFKYDYKSGNYLPKIYKESHPHLFITMSEITSGLRTAPWFFSYTFFELFTINFSNYITNLNKFTAITKDNQLQTNTKYTNSNNIGIIENFYNIYNDLNTDNEFLNKRWAAFNILDQKFYKMFNTSSMQQRIYSNWRQLKFTREAWRCKLLSARHQKTLYHRYVNEDGIFWSMERNARDLLPGWAMITPFSSRTRYTAIGKVDIGLMGVLLVLNSSIISGANFLVTYRYLSTLNNRKMRDARSFFTEGVMVASWMMIAANPMLVIGIIMLLSDRHWQTSFFDYSGGGDTVLFQHMFWFFGHPEVYIIMIPVFGFTNTILSYYLKKRISARASLLYSMYTIAFLGFFVWGHHMYMVGLAHTTRMLFSTLTVMISVPAATKLMHWCVTLANSSFTMELPLLFILTFVFFFVSGGISGMCVAHTGMDVLFHDTFYVIGHFHVMLAGSAMFGSFGAFYFYFPAIFGVKYSRIYAYLHYSYYLIGQLMTVIPMFWLGYAGMPRRVLDYPSSLGGWHSVISAGHMLSVAGLISFFLMIFDSLRQAKAATRNTLGISRYNTRLNFYIYEISRIIHVQQKGLHFYKFLHPYSIKLNKTNYNNFEYLETTLYSYVFYKKTK